MTFSPKVVMCAEAMSSDRSDSVPVISDSRPGPVEALDLDDREAVRQRVADLGARRDPEHLGAALWLGALLDHLRQPALARQHVLDQPADALGAAALVLVAVEFA